MTSENAPKEPSLATERDPRLRILIPMIVATAFLMEQLDSTIIATAIPDMARSLGTTPVRLNSAITAYVLAVAAFLPVSGWLADRFGAQRVFCFALLVFTAGSALCATATDVDTLVAMRVLQGLGGAMMTPVGRLILLRSFPRREYVTAMVYMSVPAVIGPVMGPLLGGFIATYLSWQWIFYVNIPFGLLGILFALRWIENTPGGGPRRFDIVGFLMIGTGLALLQFGIENISHPVVPMPFIVAAALIATALLLAFGWYARRVSAPIVDLTLFRFRSFAIGTLAGGICRIAINGMPYLLPLMLQIGLGMNAMASGVLTFMSSVGAIFMRPLMTPFLRRFGFKPVLIGSAIASSALMAGFSFVDADTAWIVIAVYIAVLGIFRAMQFMSSNTLAYADVPDEALSRAITLGGILQQLTVSFGVSLSAVLLTLVSGSGDDLTQADFQLVFLITAILPLPAILGFLRLRSEDGGAVSGFRKRK